MKRTINFTKFMIPALIFSVSLFAVLTAGTVLKGGFIFGIDFVGGTKVVAKFGSDVNESVIRKDLERYNPTVQQIGQPEDNEYIISTKLAANEKEADKNSEIIKKLLSEKHSGIEFLSEENVGPAIGDFLRKSAIKLFIVAMVLMTLYLAFRFEFRYSLGAMIALFHDIIMSIVFCGMAGVEINIPIIAALLTIFGYSVNDTIVIFDRIRENLNSKTRQPLREIIDFSISQSLSRTLLTTLTTMLVVFSLYIIGGDVLNDFALVLLFGLIVGTYSTVYIASPVLILWEKFASK